MTTINQWLEGKKKESEEHPMLDYNGNPIKVYNEAYDSALSDLQASLPTLLSAMEAEIRERIKKLTKSDKNGNSFNNVNGLGQYNKALDDIHTIIHEYFKTQE